MNNEQVRVLREALETIANGAYSDGPETARRALATAATPSGPAQEQAVRVSVGAAEFMPGTKGYTMVCFAASEVPVGTKLYTAPPAPTPAPAVRTLTDANIAALAESDFYQAPSIETMDLRCLNFARAIERHITAPDSAGDTDAKGGA